VVLIAREAEIFVVAAHGQIDDDRQSGEEAFGLRPPLPKAIEAPDVLALGEPLELVKRDRAQFVAVQVRGVRGGAVLPNGTPGDLYVAIVRRADIARDVDVVTGQVGLGVEKLKQIFST